MKETRNEVRRLDPEQIEKAKACKAPEESLALAKEEGYELSDDEFGDVAGGWDYSVRFDFNSAR